MKVRNDSSTYEEYHFSGIGIGLLDFTGDLGVDELGMIGPLRRCALPLKALNVVGSTTVVGSVVTGSGEIGYGISMGIVART